MTKMCAYTVYSTIYSVHLPNRPIIWDVVEKKTYFIICPLSMVYDIKWWENAEMFIYKWCLCIKNPSFINENSKSIIPCCPVAFINKHAIWFYIEIRLNLVPTSNMDVFYTDLHLSHCNCLRFWTLKSK